MNPGAACHSTWKGWYGSKAVHRQPFHPLPAPYRQAHGEDAIITLVEVMADQNAPVAARVTAAQAILDRGWANRRNPRT